MASVLWAVVGVFLGVAAVLIWIGGVAQGLRVLIDGRRAWAAWRNPPPPHVALERARAPSQSMNSQWPDGRRRLSRASVSTIELRHVCDGRRFVGCRWAEWPMARRRFAFDTACVASGQVCGA